MFYDMVLPISPPGSCSAGCPWRNPTPRNRQESHSVTMLLTQLLWNAGFLKVEHQHTFIAYSQSKNLSVTHTRSNQWGIMNPSPRVSANRWGRQHSGKAAGSIL